jgi:alkaline phosphatase D
MKLLLLLFSCAFTNAICAQIISGPMIGQVELRDAKIFLELTPKVKSVKCIFHKQSEPAHTHIVPGETNEANVYNTMHFTLSNLEPGTTYNYYFLIDGKIPSKIKYSFTTKPLWQYRTPAPDFSFLTGSCSYVNEPVYDRPGQPYGQDSTIFLSMAKQDAKFMLWLGDNWYYREVDYFSNTGLWYRAHRDRSQPILQDLLKAMPQYAIWDDHDYGPNDSDKSYHLKKESREVFKQYWLNPSYGENEEGIYTTISYSDVDIFMMDDRWFRSSNKTDAFVNGKPNPDKRMWGAKEMEWIKNALLTSQATFKLIATGNQTLNKENIYECMQNFPAEFNEFQEFLAAEKIEGVLFLTCDRHHSEVVKWERSGLYPLYDITNSPLTSSTHKVTGTKEENNPSRMPGTLVEAQNFTRITVSGPEKGRMLTVQYLNAKGEVLAQWKVNESELKIKSN